MIETVIGKERLFDQIYVLIGNTNLNTLNRLNRLSFYIIGVIDV